MCQDALCGLFIRKVFLFKLQSAAGSGKTWTLNKQTRRSSITLFIKWKGTSVCLCEKGERSKFFIHNHCNVWEPPLLLQKIHKSPLHFLINVQWLLEVFSGRERPSSLSSIPVKTHICQPPLLPPTRINDRHRVPESFLEVILENPFKRSSLHHFPNWPTDSTGSLIDKSVLRPWFHENAFVLDDVTRAYCLYHFQPSQMASEKGKFWNIRYSFLLPL